MPARGHTTYIGCSKRSHSETPESESLIGWALRSQQFICSESLEEVGEVPGAAKVPQHVVEEADCVQNLGLGYIEVDQQTRGRLKIVVSFNIGLAHVAALLLVHRQVVQAKESFPLLKAGRQRCVPNLPASRQLSPLR